MQRLFRLFLTWTLFEITTLASQPQLHNIVLHTPRRIFGTYLDNSFHVTAFSSNQTSGNLELLLVYYLDVESSSVLNRVGIFILTVIVLSRLRLSLLFLL